MVEVAPLPLHLLMLPGEQLHHFAAPFAALFATRHPTLCFLQRPLGLAIVTGVLDDFAVGGDEKHLQPDVDTRLMTGEGQRLDGHLGAGNAGIPPVRFSDNGHRLGRTLQWPMQAEGNAPNLGKAEDLALQRGAAMLTQLGIGKAVVAVLALKARVAGLFPRLDAAKEGLKGFIQPVQGILQDLGVDIVVFRPHLFDGGKLLGLLREVHRDVAVLPGSLALFQSSIVEFPAAPQDLLQRPCQFGGWE